jgi:hypothetical protein
MKTKAEKAIDKLYSIDCYIQGNCYMFGLTVRQQDELQALFNRFIREIELEERMNKESWL